MPLRSNRLKSAAGLTWPFAQLILYLLSSLVPCPCAGENWVEKVWLPVTERGCANTVQHAARLC